MKNDAFGLRWWSLDKALIWISSRDPDAVVSGSSWVEFRADRIGAWNPEVREYEYEHADPVVHPQDAEQQLLRALQNEQIEGLNGIEKLVPIWFDQADYLRNWNETLLVNWYLPVSVQIKDLSGGGQYIQRVNPDENKIPVRVPSAQVLACFPALQEEASDSEPSESAVPVRPSSGQKVPPSLRGKDPQWAKDVNALGETLLAWKRAKNLPSGTDAIIRRIHREDATRDLAKAIGEQSTLQAVIAGRNGRAKKLASSGHIRPWWEELER